MAGEPKLRPPVGAMVERDGQPVVVWMVFLQQLCDRLEALGSGAVGAGAALEAIDAALQNHERRIAALEARP